MLLSARAFEPISPEQVLLLKARCKRMPRLRHQDGHVSELGGRKRKYWKGFYYEYVPIAEGKERLVHRSLTLGWKSEMKRWEAEQKLREHIAKTLDSRGRAIAPANIAPVVSTTLTLKEFWEKRYLPIVEARWASSTRSTNVWTVETQILPRFGDHALSAITRFDLQLFLTGIAEKYSESIYHKVRVQLGAILAEAAEQGLILKSPLTRFRAPKLRKPVRPYLSEAEIAAVIAELAGRDRLIVRMFVVLGLRPGEMFVLRRNDVLPAGYLRVDEAVWQGEVKDTKTAASTACVWMPDSIRTELKWWLDLSPAAPPAALLFPSTRNTPLRRENFLARVIKTAAVRAWEKLSDEQKAAGFLRGYKGVNHQVFRRSCGTLLKKHGDVKDVQGHLRHASPDLTAGVYIQTIPESVRAAVKEFDRSLFSDSITFHHTEEPKA